MERTAVSDVVRGISLNCNLSVARSQWVRTGAVVKAFLSASKAEWHYIRECQGSTTWG